MPFTPAHPAAILPLPRLLRKWTVPSALVIGSMVPDLVYFLPLGMHRLDSHNLAALFWFCLPMGLGAYLIFHLFLKYPIYSLLPGFIARRVSHLMDETRLKNIRWLAVAASLLLGAVTHLVWDAFTHDGAPGVQAIPILRADLFAVGTYHIYAYRVLQYFSSAIGLMILFVWAVRWLLISSRGHPLAAPLTPSERFITFASLLAIPAVCGLWSASMQFSLPFTGRVLELTVGKGVIVVFDALGLVLIAYSLWWHLSPRSIK
jgi:hypothetical protein